MILEWLFPNRQRPSPSGGGFLPSKEKDAPVFVEVALLLDNIGPPIRSDDIAYYQDNPEWEYRGCYDQDGIMYHKFKFIGSPP